MGAHDDLLALEDEGWKALSTGGDAAAAFYGRVLDDDVAFLLPGGLKVDDRAKAVEMMGGQPWDWYRIVDARVLPLGEGAAAVLYTAEARRGDEPVYSALMSSTYVRRDGGWRLAVHQQSPLA